MRPVALRRPEPGQRELRIQEDELEAACWMPLAEFAANPFTAAHPIFSKVRRSWGFDFRANDVWVYDSAVFPV